MDSSKTYPRMPIKATPYQHQREAFAFACRLFGLTEDNPPATDPPHRTEEIQQEGGDAKCQKSKRAPKA